MPQHGCILSCSIVVCHAGVVAGTAFSRLNVHGNATWTPQRLAWSGVLMAWNELPQLTERWRAVGETLKQICPHWQLGSSYEGWIAAQHRASPRWVPLVVQRLRELGNNLARERPSPRFSRWKPLAVDGSLIACPRTQENQQAMGDRGKPEGIPQLSLTMLLHLEHGLPWDFRVGPGTESERAHLRSMLDDLPCGSLLVADAGFIGYELCRELIDRRQPFLFRVGGNMHLLSELGCEVDVRDDIVYLWPVKQQNKNEPPIRLRLIVLREEGQQPIYLVTNVLDSVALTDAEASEIYHARWDVEVEFRSLKQTLPHAALRSRQPETCYLEMTWYVLGLWLLQLMTAREVQTAGGDPHEISLSQARNCVRRVLRNQSPCPRTKRTLRHALGTCRQDNYERQRPKASRNYPRKKRHTPPGPPIIKPPDALQLRKAQALTPLELRI